MMTSCRIPPVISGIAALGEAGRVSRTSPALAGGKGVGAASRGNGATARVVGGVTVGGSCGLPGPVCCAPGESVIVTLDVDENAPRTPRGFIAATRQKKTPERRGLNVAVVPGV